MGLFRRYLVPDNLKTAISKHSKDELILNSAFSDLEDFYNTIVLPPPPRKPKGKPTIENHVRFLETHLIERLKENIFTSLDSLNKETQKIIATINQADFRNKNDIRRTREYAFQTYDKPKMKPLPSGSFTTCDYKYFLRIPDNYHLEYDGHYYSVLYTYHGKPAMLKATMSEIRICDENNRLLCKHVRSYKDFPRYITDDSHMPPEHLYYKELNAHDGRITADGHPFMESPWLRSLIVFFAVSSMKSRHTTAARAFCICAMMSRVISQRKRLRFVLMHLHASTLTSRKPLAVWLTTNRQETEQPGIFRNMKTSEGGTAINE